MSDENTTFKIKDVLELTKHTIDEVTPEEWAKNVQHAKKVEDAYWKHDGILDSIEVEAVVIDLEADDEDDDEEDIHFAWSNDDL